MRLLRKLVLKVVSMVVMVVLMGGALKYGRPYIMRAAGMPEAETPQFSSEESDLMGTVFKSAFRLFSGTAKRADLASELSDKLYEGRADSGTMSELGIELVKPGAGASPPEGGAGVAGALPGGKLPDLQLREKLLAKQRARVGEPPAKPGAKAGKPSAAGLPVNVRTDLLGQFGKRAKAYTVELSLVPVVFLGMVLVQRIRRRRAGGPDFVPAGLAIQAPTDTEPFDMKHAVHALGAEDFELLVALIYQRQGYRVSMPAGLSGGRGGDFTLARKSEKLLVQCKKLSQEHRVPVERVRELHEAAVAASATRSMYVASCGFTWDARNYAKANGVTLISARTLDELLTAARETPGEDLLAVSQWVPKLMSKVLLTPPLCPACEAAMDQVNASNSSVWVCSQRPECRGRRSWRKHPKSVAAAASKTDVLAEKVSALPTPPNEVPGKAPSQAPSKAPGRVPAKASAPAPAKAPAKATSQVPRKLPPRTAPAVVAGRTSR